MPCDFEKDLLDAYVDGELNPEEVKSVEEHVASCDECRAEVDAFRRLSGGIKAAVFREAPQAAVIAIRADIERREIHRRRFVFAYRALAVAATVVLVAAISLRSYREGEKEEFERIARIKAPALRDDKAAAVETVPEKKLQPSKRKAVDRETPVVEAFVAREEEALAHMAKQSIPSPTAAAPAASLREAGAAREARKFAEARPAPEPSALDGIADKPTGAGDASVYARALASKDETAAPPPAPRRAMADASVARRSRSFEADDLAVESAPGGTGGADLTRRRALAKAPLALKGQSVEIGAPPAEDLVQANALGAARPIAESKLGMAVEKAKVTKEGAGAEARMLTAIERAPRIKLEAPDYAVAKRLIQEQAKALGAKVIKTGYTIDGGWGFRMPTSRGTAKVTIGGSRVVVGTLLVPGKLPATPIAETEKDKAGEVTEVVTETMVARARKPIAPAEPAADMERAEQAEKTIAVRTDEGLYVITEGRYIIIEVHITGEEKPR